MVNFKQNILTIDLEDWYQTELYRSRIAPADWDKSKSRLDKALELLDILFQFKVKATFFVVAYCARRHPEIIRRIIAEGHEISSHGYYHNLICRQSPREFKQELKDSKNLLEDICQSKIIGFRAPKWSLNSSCIWALDIIKEMGFLYDSSMTQSFYRKTQRKIPCGLLELPREGFYFYGAIIPFAGGWTLRAYPYFLTKKLIQQKNRSGKTAIVYAHPWEFDREPLPIKLGITKSFLMNFHLGNTLDKFRSLLKGFSFTSVKDCYFNKGAV